MSVFHPLKYKKLFCIQKLLVESPKCVSGLTVTMRCIRCLFFSFLVYEEKKQNTKQKPDIFLNQELRKTSKIASISEENSLTKYEANTIDWEMKKINSTI